MRDAPHPSPKLPGDPQCRSSGDGGWNLGRSTTYQVDGMWRLMWAGGASMYVHIYIQVHFARSPRLEKRDL